MGCTASIQNDGNTNGGSKKKSGRKGRKDRSNRDTSEREDDDRDSVTKTTSMEEPATGRKDFDEVAAAGSPRARHPEEDDLSDISSTDLGASLARATTASAALPSAGRGLDKEREETEVDLETEFFVWDDANLDLKDMRAKASARKNMAAARNKNFLASHSIGDAKAGGPRGAKGSFVFNDFTIEDSATLDALSDSTRAGSFRKQRNHPPPGAANKDESSAVAPPGSGIGATSVDSKEVSQSHESVGRAVARAPKRPPGDIRNFTLTTRIGHSSRVKCLAIAPGEREYVSCSNDDSIITYYDVRGSQELGIYSGHQDTVIHAVFSPCGKFLATTSRDNTLVLWDVVTQKAILTFEHGKVVICCAFSRSSKFIATGCQDKVCRLWECRRGRELVAFTQHEGIIIALSISPDEQHVVSASADKTLRIWTASKGRAKAVLRGHNHIILACNYNAAGDRIVSNDERSVRVWSAPQGQLLRTIMVDDLIKLRNPPPNKKQSWTLSCLAPKTFPRHIVVASNNRMVFVIDMESGEEVLSVDTKAPVYCLAPGHRSLVAYGDSFGNVYFLKLEAFDEEEPLDDRPGGADWA